jgi:catechol 2,3-dioxygenase-like lactoylglutathione lyase family enzyme
MKELSFSFDHVAISVKDLDEAIQWYSDIFGFEQIRLFDRPDLKMKGAQLKLGTIKLEIFQPYEPNELPSYRKTLESDLQTLGTKHFALNVNDLVSAYKELKKSGVSFLGEPKIGKTSKYVFCQDPSGTLIELREDL